MENLIVQFKEKLVELERFFDIVASQNSDNTPVMIAVSQNSSLVVRISMDFWACRLSSKECNFLRELLQYGGEMDRNATGSLAKELSDGAIRQFVESTNKKLRSKNMPIKLSFKEWVISIKFLSAKFG